MRQTDSLAQLCFVLTFTSAEMQMCVLDGYSNVQNSLACLQWDTHQKCAPMSQKSYKSSPMFVHDKANEGGHTAPVF